MDIRLFAIIFFTCILLISCGEKNTPEAKMVEGTMGYFIEGLDLKVGGKYKDILAERKHTDDRIAPEVVRSFIEEIEPIRFSFSQGVKFEQDQATLWWFVSDFGAKGKPEQVLAIVKSLLEKQGFVAQEPKEDEHGWMEYRFVKETDELDYLVKMKGLDRFVGSKEPMCGGDIVFDVTCNKPLQPQTVDDMVKLYPQIACPELPLEVFEYLKGRKITYMKYGGTWQRYYTWGVTVPIEDEEAAENMRGDVEEIIEGLGYSLWKDEGGIKTYQKQGSGGETPSFMDLEIDGSLFEVRFQPRS